MPNLSDVRTAGESSAARPTTPSTGTLLWSLSFYADLLHHLSGVANSPDIVEIGSETGAVSRLLSAFAAERGGRLTVVEPFPSELLRSLEAEAANIDIVEGYSPEGLTGVPPAGLYAIDGDHNYGVVTGELEAIFTDRLDPSAVVVLHDVGWPFGRRDGYYDPSRLPPDQVHPYRWDSGAVLDLSPLQRRRGYRGHGNFAMAEHEGGPRNGVLSAVEDFVAANPHLGLLRTPLVFGLAVVGDARTPSWKQVEELMVPYTDNPTLAEMERNRMALVLRTIENTDLYKLRTLRDAVAPIRRTVGALLRYLRGRTRAHR